MQKLILFANIFILVLITDPAVLENSNALRSKRNQTQGCVLPEQLNFGNWKISGQEIKNPGERVPPGTIILVTCDIDRKFITTTTGVYCLRSGHWHKDILDCISPSTCGNKLKYAARKTGRALVFNGTQLTNIVYPWIAAVFRDTGRTYENVCGGSIITKKVILTAAHCLTDNHGYAYPAHIFQIGVAKLYNLYIDTRDKHAQLLNVQEIVVYPGYGGEKTHSFGDLAMMVTETSIKLSALSHPICIKNVGSIHLRTGIDVAELAGWGKTEDDKVSDPLRFLKIPHKDQNQCMQELGRKFTKFHNLTGKICAGFHRQEMSVCVGDSGSALAFQNPEDKLYYIHGIVSVMPGAAELGVCNSAANTLYTDVAYFYDWIMEELKKRNETIDS